MEMATERVHAQGNLESERKSSETPAPHMAVEDHALAVPVARALSPSGSAPIQRSARLLSSPMLRSPGSGGLRAVALRQAQQGYGNRFAQRVMRHHSAVVQRQCACGGVCAECNAAGAAAVAPVEERPIQRQAAGTSPLQAPASVIPESSRGEALDEGTQADMRGRFGRDFQDVRVHRDGDAAASSHLLEADAYTTGRDIYFAAGQYQPGTHQGRRLLAHELTHVVQQSEGAVPANSVAMHAAGGVMVGHPDDPLEHEAEHTADRVMAGGHANMTSGEARGVEVQRQSATPTPPPPTAASPDAATTISDAIRNNNVGAAVPPLRDLSVDATRVLRDAVYAKSKEWMEKWLIGRQNRAKNINTAKTVLSVAAGVLVPGAGLATTTAALLAPSKAPAENGTSEEGLRLLWPALPLIDRLEIYNEWHRELEQAQIDTIRAASADERVEARKEAVAARLGVIYALMSPKEEYDARVLIDGTPDGKVTATEKLLVRAPGVFSNDKDPVYDAIIGLPPADRTKFFNDHFLQLLHLLSASEFTLISQLSKASEAQALIIRLRLATEGRIDDMAAVQAVVDRAVELLKERRVLRASVSAPGLTDKDRTTAQERLKELDDLDTLLDFHPGAKGELPGRSFMGMLSAARGDPGAFGADTGRLAEFATDKRKYAFEAGKQRILLARGDVNALRVALFSVHAPAVDAAPGANREATSVAQLAEDIKLREELVKDKDVAGVINDLRGSERQLVLLATTGDSYNEILNQLAELRNTAQWGAFFDLLLNKIARNPDFLQRFEKSSGDAFGVYAGTFGEERKIMLLILQEKRMPLTAVLRYTGNVATLRTALSNIGGKEREQLRLGWSLVRQRPTGPLTQDQEQALTAFKEFEAEARKSQTTVGIFDAAGFEAVLSAALGAEPSAEDMKSDEGRYRAVSIMAERVEARLALGRGASAFFTETDETMEAAGREFEALWLRVKDQQALKPVVFFALTALYNQFDKRAEEFTEASKAITDMAGTIAATVAGIVVVAATGGAATPAVIALAAAAGAGAGVVTREAFGGDYYNALSSEGARAALLDAINGALAVVSGGLAARGAELLGLGGRALTQGAAKAAGSVVEQATQSFARKVAASAVEAAIDGLFSGAVSEGFGAMTDDLTWRKGIMAGLVRAGQAAILGGLTGLAGGAVLGAALPVASRGISKLGKAVAGQGLETTLVRAGVEDVLNSARAAARRGDVAEVNRLAEQLEAHLNPEEASLLRQQLGDQLTEKLGHPPGTAKAESEAQQKLLSDAGKKEDGLKLTQEERRAELDIVKNSEPQISREPGYVDEVELGNGHTWRRTEEGDWCRFTKKTLCQTKIPDAKPSTPSALERARAAAAAADSRTPLLTWTSRRQDSRGARVWIEGNEAQFRASKSGYHVYEYLDEHGALLYVGKSGGAEGTRPANWTQRLEAEHINTPWIGEARSVRVTYDLTEQEMWAMEEALIPTASANINPGEYSRRSKGGNLSANFASAVKQPHAVFAIDSAPVRSSR